MRVPQRRKEVQELKSRNPLHKIILIAKINAAVWHKVNGEKKSEITFGKNWLIPVSNSAVSTPFPKFRGEPLYPRIEMAGVAGLYFWLDANSDYEVIFCNDLAEQIHGIDAVAYDPAKDHYIICEAKGTTGRFKSPACYLKETVRSGRQLTWQWCWNSLLGFAETPSSAQLFLTLCRPIIENRTRRLLSVTHAESYSGGYAIQETRVWNEEDMHGYKWFSQRKEWSKHKRWLGDLPDI